MGHGSKWGTNAVSECIYVCYLRYDRQNAHHSNKDSDGRGGKINDLSRQTEIIFLMLLATRLYLQSITITPKSKTKLYKSSSSFT